MNIRHLLWGMVALSLAAALIAAPAGAQGMGPDQPEVRGAPTRIDPGALTGYLIWMDGETVAVRWTARASHRFTGEVTVDAPIAWVRGTNLERGDIVRRADYGVSWDATASGGMDGFDFATRGATTLRLVFYIDGRLARRDQIFLGRGLQHPGGNPFALRLGGGAGFDRWPSYVHGQPYGFGGPGYYIWVDERGWWQMRWVTRGWGREASGLVTTDGRLTDVRRIGLEEGDSFARDDSLIAWETRGRFRDQDGFMFRAQGNRLTFTLLIDGMPAGPGQIFIGSGGVRPSHNPFRLGR
jgi:hypothetical protein